MPDPDAEMSAVTLVLFAAAAEEMPATLAELQAAGLRVTLVNKDVGVVEGDVATAKLPDLKKNAGVERVRVRFNWIAEYPPGDPRHVAKDSDEDSEEPED
jgi:hypothetical protein